MEIERKFLLNSLPNLIPEEHIEISQVYVSVDPEIRIQSYRVLKGEDIGHIEYKLIVKGSGTLSHEEIETNISEAFFLKVAKFIDKPLIHKDYQKYILGDGEHILECSVVDSGTENEFIYCEVEFASEEEALAYELPLDGAQEVTYDTNYKMKNYWIRTRM